MDNPYWVQAFRKGQFTQWYTDSRWPTYLQARQAAQTLVEEWHRKVRVIDGDSGRVLVRLEPETPGGRPDGPEA